MSTLSDLQQELQSLRRCGEILTAIADSLTELLSAQSTGVAAQNKKEAAQPAGPAARPNGTASQNTKKSGQPAEPKASTDKPDTLSMEEVRTVLSGKARCGYTEEVKAILKSHGCDRLADLDTAQYAAVLEEVNALH